jgi:single-stranded DNA-binding protein
VTEIIANDVQFLEPRGSGGGGASAPSRGAAGVAHDEVPVPAPDDAPRDVDPDDIPF